MNFTLFYLERLPSANSSSSRKINNVRCRLSPQIRKLYDYAPLREMNFRFEPDDERDQHFCLYRERNGHPYTCLVDNTLGLACRLNVTFFENKGDLSVASQLGDIDNRMKPLLDALSLPKENLAIHSKKSGTSQETTHCLLSDDSLVWGLGIRRKRLLMPFLNGCEALTQIEVEIIPTRSCFDIGGIFGISVF